MRQQTRSRIADGLERTHLIRPAARLREGWLTMRAPCQPAAADGLLLLPPPRLRLLVDGRSGDARRFLHVGAQMFDSIRGAVADSGSNVEEMRAALDFGCGCGRVARHWATVEGPELHGCDYNRDLVAWCDEQLPFLRAARNELVPPTPYVTQSFDLIYALSVLSHLSELLQRDWIAEFHRLLRPGGLLVVSVLGESVRERLTIEERHSFDRGELVVERPRLSGRNLCTAYHPRPYVTDSLLADFTDVRSFDLGSPELALLQDAYIARR
ncbi:MAG TPA: class I SAM-dependent methyltransferase [Solirubrobacterales bacterium]|nr:class I SAM-dependent methyltransferase [Solirubrobacterales bacterium]